MKKKINHTTLRNNKLLCLNCGGDYPLVFPLPVSGMDSLDMKIGYFNKLHADCKPTWTEPEADQSQSVKEKAMWWIANGHIGNSSKTMWSCLMGSPEGSYPINHPYDHDDFSRCYKLLQAVPEWKAELHKLKPLSKAWSNLVDNWDKLTDMYELNEKQEWKKYKEVGMYEFMGTLID